MSLHMNCYFSPSIEKRHICPRRCTGGVICHASDITGIHTRLSHFSRFELSIGQQRDRIVYVVPEILREVQLSEARV